MSGIDDIFRMFPSLRKATPHRPSSAGLTESERPKTMTGTRVPETSSVPSQGNNSGRPGSAPLPGHSSPREYYGGHDGQAEGQVGLLTPASIGGQPPSQQQHIPRPPPPRSMGPPGMYYPMPMMHPEGHPRGPPPPPAPPNMAYPQPLYPRPPPHPAGAGPAPAAAAQRPQGPSGKPAFSQFFPHLQPGQAPPRKKKSAGDLTKTSAKAASSGSGAAFSRRSDSEDSHERRRSSVAPPAGVSLSGSRVAFKVELDAENNLGTRRRSLGGVGTLSVNPITLYKSNEAGRGIAVNWNYICYAIKGGMIRVIHRKTGARLLLKGHTRRVVDLQFFSEKDDLLASADETGEARVWKLSEDGDQVGEIHHRLVSMVGSAKNAPAEASNAQTMVPVTLCWHPRRKGQLAFTSGPILKMVNIESSATAEDKAVGGPEDEEATNDSKVSEATQETHRETHSCAVTASCFSPCGRYLVTGDVCGEVVVWKIGNVEVAGAADAAGTLAKVSSFHVDEDQREAKDEDTEQDEAQSGEGRICSRSIDHVGFFRGADEEACALLTAHANSSVLKIWSNFSTEEARSVVQSVIVTRGSKMELAATKSSTGSTITESKLPASMDLRVTGTNQILVDPQQRFVLQFNSKDKVLLVLKLKSSVDAALVPQFRHATEYNLAYPVLAGTLLRRDQHSGEQSESTENINAKRQGLADSARTHSNDDDGGDGTNRAMKTVEEAARVADSDGAMMDLYVIQTEAIQQYEMPSEVCHPVQASQLVSAAVKKDRTDTLENGKAKVAQDQTLSAASSEENEEKKTEEESTEEAATLIQQEVKKEDEESTREQSDGQEEQQRHSQESVADDDVTSEGEALSESAMPQEEDSASDARLPTRQSTAAEDTCENVGQTVGAETTEFAQATSEASEEPTTSTSGTYATGDQSGDQTSERSVESNAAPWVPPARDDRVAESRHAASRTAAAEPLPASGIDSSSWESSASSSPEAPASTAATECVSATVSASSAGSTRTLSPPHPAAGVPQTQSGADQGTTPLPAQPVAAAAVEATLRPFLCELEERERRREQQHQQALQSLMSGLSDKINVAVQQAVKKETSQVVVPALGRMVIHSTDNIIVKGVQKNTEESMQSFQSELRSGLQRDMDEVVRRAVVSALDSVAEDQSQKAVGAATRQIASAVAAQVHQPARQAFRECFQEAIIPSFQAATQKMFEQINDTFMQGVGRQTQGDAAAEFDAVKKEMKTLSGSVNALAKSLAELNGRLEELSANTEKIAQMAGSGDAGVGPGLLLRTNSGSLVNPEIEIEQLITEERFEEALSKALSAADADLVSWACSKMEAKEVVGQQPPQLSSTILLCLVQQFGASLRKKSALKLEWMREALLGLDPSDASIQPHVARVLSETRDQLDRFRTEVQRAKNASERSLTHQVVMLRHIVNSLLMAER